MTTKLKVFLGHELGHVALGHSLAEMKASYAIVAARDAISATSGVASQLSAHNWVISQKALLMLNTPVIKSPKQMISPLIC